MEATAERIADVSAAGSLADLTTRFIWLLIICGIGTYTSRRAGFDRPYSLVSATVPMMVIHLGGLFGAGRPKWKRFPIGSPLGKYCWASVALIIATAGAVSLSASVRVRPLTRRTP